MAVETLDGIVGALAFFSPHRKQGDWIHPDRRWFASRSHARLGLHWLTI
jgi:hypothetical protein